MSRSIRGIPSVGARRVVETSSGQFALAGAGWPHHLLPLLASLAAVIALTWPVLPEAGTALPYPVSDGLQHTWNLWWARQALLIHPTNPFWASSLYYPDGASLYFHTLGLAAAPLGIPLLAVFDPPTTLVLTLLGLVWLTALTSYFLLWDIVRHRPAALVGGLVVALAPAHLFHLYLGQINLTALYPLPLVLLAQRLAQRRRHWGWVAAGAVAVALCGLADWQYLVQALFLSGLLLVVVLVRGRRHPARALREALWGTAPLVGGLLLLAPLVLAMIADLDANQDYAIRPDWQVGVRSVDLLAPVAPNPYHPLWGEAGREFYRRLYPLAPFGGGVASFGLVALGLALAAAWRRRPPALLWLGLLVVGLVMAFGPDLHLNGSDLGLPLPYRLLRQVPYMSVSRVPAIFLKWALLALAVLVALGLRAAAARFGRGRRGALALGALSGLLVLEGVSVPVVLPSRPALSACYQVLATDPRPGAVLDLPAEDSAGPMYYQTFHGRPVAGGKLSRNNPYDFLVLTPVVRQLARSERRAAIDIFPTARGAWSRQALAAWGIRWIVFHPADAGGELREFEVALRNVFGDLRPACADEHAQLWHVDDTPGLMLLAARPGWYPPERWEDGALVRWMENEGVLWMHVPQAGTFELRAMAAARHYPRAVELWVDGARQGQWEVPAGPRAPVSATLRLPSGTTALRLRAVEPASRGDGKDKRLLTVALSELELRPAAGAP